MASLVFVTPAYPKRSILRTFLLVASMREFAGDLAKSQLWVLFPGAIGEFNKEEAAFLQGLDVKLIPYDVDEELLKFPLGAKVQAAAVAEQLASGETDLLVWLDPDTLILSPLEEFILSEGKCLAYRPVHHKLLGTSWGEEPDDFWRLVYQHTGADPEKDFRMISHTGENIRPYFNAGSFVVRPERGVLAGWWKNFQSCYQLPEFKSFYKRDPLYAVFTHQAVLTGTIQNMLNQAEMQALSPSINYPLHLHGEIPEDLRATSIDDLVTVRYENIFEQPDWQDSLPFSDELAGWISSRLDQFSRLGGQR